MRKFIVTEKKIFNTTAEVTAANADAAVAAYKKSKSNRDSNVSIFSAEEDTKTVAELYEEEN